MADTTDRPLVKLTRKGARALTKGLDRPGEATDLILTDTPAEALFAALIERDLHAFAADALAAGLPKREAVWWACLAARAALPLVKTDPDAVPGLALKALEAAEAFVFKPGEAERRACFPPAEADGFASPCAWAAMAAYWSGGSLTPPELPAVPPADHLTGVAAAAAVKLAVALLPPPQMAAGWRRLLAQGLDIAAGGNGRIAG